MAAKASMEDGKGYEYPAIGHVVGLDGKIREERRRLYMDGYLRAGKKCRRTYLNAIK
ncbi:hypothetical protein KE531_07040 [Eubacteriaceae bacterium Marseille-Q4139]|nr:hypothetical protein [Eubacteriaceae bacterium Marseille-Q4139]